MISTFRGLFYCLFDAAIQCNDIPVEKYAIVSRYGHGRYQRFLQPLPFSFDTLRIAAFLIGVYIIDQDEVRPEILVTGTTRGLSGADSPE